MTIKSPERERTVAELDLIKSSVTGANAASERGVSVEGWQNGAVQMEGGEAQKFLIMTSKT